MYVKIQNGGNLLLLCLYVDHLLVTGSDLKEIEDFNSLMMSEFEMTNLGRLTYFLRMEFVKTPKGTMLHQQKYATEVLKRFNMVVCNTAATPSETNIRLEEMYEEEVVDSTLFNLMVGSLRYLHNIRPDICFAVGLISRFMDNPRKTHLIAAKRILKYLKGALNFRVLFPNETQQQIELLGYSDSDWCGDRSDRKSTTGYIFKFLGAPISWCSMSNLLWHYHHVKLNT